MAYIAPTTRATGALISAAIYNADLVDNITAINAGAIAVASQATGDLLTASSATQLTRIAAGTSGLVLTANGAGVAPSYQAAAGGLDFIQSQVFG